MKLLTYPAALGALCAVLATACTPKAPVAETSPQQPSTVSAPKADEQLSPCPKFSDLPNGGQIEDQYVIYRDFLRTGQTDKALTLWRQVYAVAPAADGRRNTVLTDGIYFMELAQSQTTDPARQRAYRDTIFSLYDQIAECYPADGASMQGRKAFDYFYKYRGDLPDREIYDMFVAVKEADGMKAGDFILNPLASLVVDLHEAGELSQAEARETVDFILERIRVGKASAKTQEERERWAIIEGYAPERLAYFETVRGFYDCAYFKNKYLPEFEEAREDYLRLSQLAGYLRFGGCPEGDPDLQRIVAQANAVRPRQESGQTGCFALINDGKYREAIECLEGKYNEASDPEKKAQYALVIAKLYYGNLRNFGQSRQWARRAADHKGGWGEPYILIGKLYASSGPLCGSGTGFNSQRVVWVAIDQWNRAKSIDGGVAGEANKLIGRYAQYMPTREDIFQRGLKVGQSYTVDCWINESTTVRTR